jgi:hypothetical protein
MPAIERKKTARGRWKGRTKGRKRRVVRGKR